MLGELLEQMRDQEKESLRQSRRKEEFIEFLGDMILEDDGIPEYRKVELRILNEVKALCNKVQKTFAEYGAPEMDDKACERMYPARKDALEYLKLVGAGIDLFAQQHPAPKLTKDSYESWKKGTEV